MFNCENNTVACYIENGDISDEFREALFCIGAEAYLCPPDETPYDYPVVVLYWDCLIGPLDALCNLGLRDGVTDECVGKLVEELNEEFLHAGLYHFLLPTLEARAA